MCAQASGEETKQALAVVELQLEEAKAASRVASSQLQDLDRAIVLTNQALRVCAASSHIAGIQYVCSTCVCAGLLHALPWQILLAHDLSPLVAESALAVLVLFDLGVMSNCIPVIDAMPQSLGSKASGDTRRGTG